MKNASGSVDASVFTLQLPQWVAVQDLLQHYHDGERELGLVGPTGWGKSVIVTVLLHHMLGSGCEAAVVAVPKVAIEGSFETRKGLIHVVPEVVAGAVSWVPPVDPSLMWLRARDLEGSARAAFGAHVGPGTPHRPVMITTHQALVRWLDDIRELDLTGRVLVLDECHHAHDKAKKEHGTLLAEFRRVWIERGGTVLGLTATPFRTNNKPVFGPSARLHTYTQAEHSAAGNAPSQFQFRMEFFEFEAQTQAQMEGEALPEDELRIGTGHDKIIKTWTGGGRPKTIIYVPPGKSREWGAALIERLAEVCPPERIFNAVGPGGVIQRRLDGLLERERARAADPEKGFAASEVDIIVSCRRMTEGVDWPFCSHVYKVGLGRSYQDTLQIWGRGSRFKGRITGYPDEHRDVCSMTHFVPRAGDGVRGRLAASHHRHALLLTAGLSDFATGHAYWTELVLRDAIHGSGSSADAKDAVARSRRSQRVMTDVERRARARARLVTLMSGLAGGIQLARLHGLAAHDIDSMDDDRDAVALTTTLLDEVARQDPDVREALVRRLHGVADAVIEAGDGAHVERVLRDRLRSVLAEVATEYADRTVVADEGPVEIISQFTGQDSTEISRQLKGGLDNFRPSRERVVEVMTEFWDAHQRPPNLKPCRTEQDSPSDSDVIALPEADWTWLRVGQYIREHAESLFDKNDRDAQSMMGGPHRARAYARRWVEIMWRSVRLPMPLEFAKCLVIRHVLVTAEWPKATSETETRPHRTVDDRWVEVTYPKDSIDYIECEAPYGYDDDGYHRWTPVDEEFASLEAEHEGVIYRGLQALCVLVRDEIYALRPSVSDAEAWVRACRRETGLDLSRCWSTRHQGAFPDVIQWPPDLPGLLESSVPHYSQRFNRSVDRWDSDALDKALRRGFFHPEPFPFPHPLEEFDVRNEEHPSVTAWRKLFIEELVEGGHPEFRTKKPAEVQRLEDQRSEARNALVVTTLSKFCAGLPWHADECLGLHWREAQWLSGVALKCSRDGLDIFSRSHLASIRKHMRSRDFGSENERQAALFFHLCRHFPDLMDNEDLCATSPFAEGDWPKIRRQSGIFDQLLAGEQVDRSFDLNDVLRATAEILDQPVEEVERRVAGQIREVGGDV